MIAETYATSLIKQFSVPDKINVPDAYYRSKLVVAAISSNLLVAAASPIFSLLERLSISSTLPPIESIHANLEHELHAFYSRLTSQNYNQEFSLIAHYFLCATVDELLGKNYLRLFGKPAAFKAFTPPSTSEIGPQQRFFEMITQLQEQPNQFLDLIELAYYCLITGFEGEYHLRPDGRQALDNIIESLYQQIQYHRANKPYQLFGHDPLITTVTKKTAIPLIISLFFVGSLLAIAYIASNTMLEHQAHSMLLAHKTLTNQEQYG